MHTSPYRTYILIGELMRKLCIYRSDISHIVLFNQITRSSNIRKMNFINQSNSNQVYNSSMTWTPFTAPSIWSPFYSMPTDSDSDQSLNQSSSPFSTPASSPFGSPPAQSFSQYFSTSVPKLPEPIARPAPSSRQVMRQRNQVIKLPKRSENVDMSEFIRKSRSGYQQRNMVCTFCKSNGESEEIYTSHSLKSSNNKITCPILMKYTCVECGASGENTHTIKYCPVMQKKLKQQLLNKFTISNN